MSNFLVKSSATDLTPTIGGPSKLWNGLAEGAGPLAVNEFLSLDDVASNTKDFEKVVVVTKDAESADSWLQSLKFFRNSEDPKSGDFEYKAFPDWETLPYDFFSPHQNITSSRIDCLYDLSIERKRLVVTIPVTTLLQKIAPPAFISGSTFRYETGQKLTIDNERLKLDSSGYVASNLVTQRGQYAIRGSVIDIFPMGSNMPVRVDLFDDEIDSLRLFDPDTQMTVEEVKEFRLLPGKEFPFDDDAIKRFKRKWHETFFVDARSCPIYVDVQSYIAPSGIEYFAPLFFDRMADFFDYVPKNTLFVLEPGLEERLSEFHLKLTQRYSEMSHDLERPILDPSELFLNPEELHESIKQYRTIRINNIHNEESFFRSGDLQDVLPDSDPRSIHEDMAKFLSSQAKKIILVTESLGRREILEEKFRDHGLQLSATDSFTKAKDLSDHAILTGSLQKGFITDEVIAICERDFKTKTPIAGKHGRRTSFDSDQIIRNLNELSMGSPVVHIEHGVGRFLGLEILTIDEEEDEFLSISYAEGAKLYVPVSSLHLVSRYSGAEESSAPLHRLGSEQWNRAKRKATEKVRDIAAELLDIYARRRARRTEKMSIDEDDLEAFSEEFPFELTRDQADTVAETLNDLSSEKATDRLICGDVGFGKTEVALRAALVAVQNRKQIAVLVPTTLLAQQHFDTFKNRFANWPVSIASVSRMNSNKDNAIVAEGCKSGKLDIVIGTHKLLGPEFIFKNLGLVIIDEEHRFGVKQKESIRALRAEVDILAMTATPIPRTLNMSLSGIRDLSIISTPPENRLPVKTFVKPFREHLVQEAIRREILRGGQVFLIHNDVKTIELSAEIVRKLVPEARIGIAHGQMRKTQLETIMSDFHHRRSNVLVCSTIVENGLDIPNANTIIIQRADKLGLSQLHQLRGRVGRSNRQAYAFLLLPEEGEITNDAKKRLEAIELSESLGGGFTLASHDMEIRGAGELLGEDQSGQIESVGFSLYMELLDKAVKALERGELPDDGSPFDSINKEINFHTSTLIPERYLPDTESRLILYKRVAGAETKEALTQLQVEMIDRFGLLPNTVKNLFTCNEVKLRCTNLGIPKLDLGENGGAIEFSNQTSVDPQKMIALVQTQKSVFELSGPNSLKISYDSKEFEGRVHFANIMLDFLDGTNSELNF